MTSKSESIKVVVRCRPMNKKEIANKNQDIVSVDSKRKMIACKNPNPEKSITPITQHI